MRALALVAGLGLLGGDFPLTLRAAIHVHTDFSDGEHSVTEIARAARRAGVDVVVLSDHFMGVVEYGAPFFREAVALSERVPSLSPARMNDYFRAVREAERETGVLMLPGVELTPFYYWQGSPLSGSFTLRSADRHLLIVFPDEIDPGRAADALANVASPAGRRFHWRSLLLLWPLAPGIWAVRRLLSPRFDVRRTRYFVIRRRRRVWLAFATAFLSLVILVRSWPFTVPRFDPYRGDAGVAPHQYALDVAGDARALTFWAHPEASVDYRHPRYPVAYRSEPYPELVERTRGVTGFASLYEGYRETSVPGGFWDRALLDFSRGRRERPVWTIGEISLHRQGEAGGKRMGQVETVLGVSERSRAAVLEALAKGTGYAVRHGTEGRLVLDEFAVTSAGRKAGMGESLLDAGTRSIRIRLHREGWHSSVDPIRIAVIRGGTSVWEESLRVTEDGISLVFEDDVTLDGTSYYRLWVEGKYPEMLIGNPVFVYGGGDAP